MDRNGVVPVALEIHLHMAPKGCKKFGRGKLGGPHSRVKDMVCHGRLLLWIGWPDQPGQPEE